MYYLKEVPKDFLKNTVIGGCLWLNSLTEKDKIIAKSNIKKLKEGYNKEKQYCYFDGILRKVLSVKNLKSYTIYKTPFDYVIQKDNFTSHAKTTEKGIEDVEFKIKSEK